MQRLDDRQARLAGHAARGNAMRTHLAAGLKGGPEPEKGPEGERKENSIACIDFRARIDSLPALEHPLPAFGRVEPPKRRSRRRRGVVVPRVPVERLAEIRAP